MVYGVTLSCASRATLHEMPLQIASLCTSAVSLDGITVCDGDAAFFHRCQYAECFVQPPRRLSYRTINTTALLVHPRPIGPIGSASCTTLQWEIVPGASNTCRPKGTPAKPATTAGRTATGNVTVAAPAAAATPGKPVMLDGCSIPALTIKTRHHFSSKLQRMSTVARTQVWWGGAGFGGVHW